jgi:hypothetical protein
MPDVAEVLTDRSARAGGRAMRRLALALSIAVAVMYGGSLAAGNRLECPKLT